MLIDLKFTIGQRVFLDTDREQNERIVTGVNVRQSGMVFELACGTTSSWHYDFEILEAKDVVKSITQNID